MACLQSYHSLLSAMLLIIAILQSASFKGDVIVSDLFREHTVDKGFFILTSALSSRLHFPLIIQFKILTILIFHDNTNFLEIFTFNKRT